MIEGDLEVGGIYINNHSNKAARLLMTEVGDGVNLHLAGGEWLVVYKFLEGGNVWCRTEHEFRYNFRCPGDQLPVEPKDGGK